MREENHIASTSTSDEITKLTCGPTTPGGPGGPTLPWKPYEYNKKGKNYFGAHLISS